PMLSRAHAPSLRAGPALDPVDFRDLRRRLVLDGCKWDPQVGDVATIAPFPLILVSGAWRNLSAAAETLARESVDLETSLLYRRDLHARLGLSRPLRRALRHVPCDAPLGP